MGATAPRRCARAAPAGWPLVRSLQYRDDRLKPKQLAALFGGVELSAITHLWQLCRAACARGFSRMRKAQQIDTLLQIWDADPIGA